MVEWYTRQGAYHQEIKKLIKNLENDDEYYERKPFNGLNAILSKENKQKPNP
jgi:hypothetical protein